MYNVITNKYTFSVHLTDAALIPRTITIDKKNLYIKWWTYKDLIVVFHLTNDKFLINPC